MKPSSDQQVDCVTPSQSDLVSRLRKADTAQSLSPEATESSEELLSASSADNSSIGLSGHLSSDILEKRIHEITQRHEILLKGLISQYQNKKF